jgi:streptogramin lyase
MAAANQTEKDELDTKYGKLATDVDLTGDILHREITAIVNRKKSDIADLKNKHLLALNQNTDNITQRLAELRQIIADLKSMMESNDVTLTSGYKSRNAEFRTLPPTVRATLPTFNPQDVNKDRLNDLFVSLSSLCINTEPGHTMESPKPSHTMESTETVASPPMKRIKQETEAVASPPMKRIKQEAEAVASPPMKRIKQETEAVASPPMKRIKQEIDDVASPPVTPLLDDPHVTAAIDTGYIGLRDVSCVSEDQVWTCGSDNTMKLLNLRGDLLTSIQTKSGGYPGDIAVTRDGDLVYTDGNNHSINLVKKNKHRTLISPQGWRPRGVCCTAAGELLVTIYSKDKQSKVVRYSGSTKTQTIRDDDQGRPLYSGPRYISENSNQDVCVSDITAKSVVVVTASGKLRFRYTGPPSNTGRSFDPHAITTNSQAHILVADYNNDRVHLLDQDGQFLRYILCGLSCPYGLCVDIRDNLWVGEWHTAKVKRIKYL